MTADFQQWAMKNRNDAGTYNDAINVLRGRLKKTPANDAVMQIVLRDLIDELEAKRNKRASGPQGR